MRHKTDIIKGKSDLLIYVLMLFVDALILPMFCVIDYLRKDLKSI